MSISNEEVLERAQKWARLHSKPQWRNRMFERLMTQRDDVLMVDQYMGLDPEFSMRVEWLPGGRIEEGELILDPAIDDGYGRRQEKRVSSVVRGLILNLVQEYGDLEYINLGSVLPSPKRDERRGGRREVAALEERLAAGEVHRDGERRAWLERFQQGHEATAESRRAADQHADGQQQRERSAPRHRMLSHRRLRR